MSYVPPTPPFVSAGTSSRWCSPTRRTARRQTVLERVRASFARRMPGVTISCGVASVRHEDTVSLQELWERADSALYQAKRLGRDRTVAFSNLTVGVTVAADKLDAVHDLCDSGVRLQRCLPAHLGPPRGLPPGT